MSNRTILASTFGFDDVAKTDDRFDVPAKVEVVFGSLLPPDQSVSIADRRSGAIGVLSASDRLWDDLLSPLKCGYDDGGEEDDVVDDDDDDDDFDDDDFDELDEEFDDDDDDLEDDFDDEDD